MYYQLTPEVAGHLGHVTVIDRSGSTVVARSVEYVFDDWPEDDLIESFPCFIVTDLLKRLIEGAQASGCRFGPVTVSTSEQFDELEKLQSISTPRQLPAFSSLIVDGVAGRDDFGISGSRFLVVSERLLQVLKRGKLDNCDVEEF